jgi:hypothetical protein
LDQRAAEIAVVVGAQLASDRTSCRSAGANKIRLILHTAAYWLLWRIQQGIPKTAALATEEFTTLRLLKVAARVTKSDTRIRVAFASGLSEHRSAARHRARAEACAEIARATAPPKPRAQPFNPRSPPIPTR